MYSRINLSYCVFIPASTLKTIHERRGSSCSELLGVRSTLKFTVESMVHPLLTVYCVAKDCDMKMQYQFNERASFLSGHWIYGDCILASYYNNNGYMVMISSIHSLASYHLFKLIKHSLIIFTKCILLSHSL